MSRRVVSRRALLAGGAVNALAALAGCENVALPDRAVTTPTAALVGRTNGSGGSDPLIAAGGGPPAPSVPAPTATPLPTPTPTATATPEPPTPEPEPTVPPILNGDPWWHDAVQTPDGARLGVVTAVGLN